MKRKVAKLIRQYAATFGGVDPRAPKKMERIAKKNYHNAGDKEKRSIVQMMETRVRQAEAANGVHR